MNRGEGWAGTGVGDVGQSMLEIDRSGAHSASMDRDLPEAPAHWIEELARSDAERARGERVPASVVHDDMKRALAEVEAECADGARASVRTRRGR